MTVSDVDGSDAHGDGVQGAARGFRKKTPPWKQQVAETINLPVTMEWGRLQGVEMLASSVRPFCCRDVVVYR